MSNFNIKQLTSGLLVLGLLSGHVHASGTQVGSSPTESVAGFSQNDLHALFGEPSQPTQLATLSNKEMKETEGAWVPIAVGGLAGGLYNGISYYNSSSNLTARGWATAIGSGVIGGAVSGVSWWSAPIWGGGITAAGGWAASNLR